MYLPLLWIVLSSQKNLCAVYIIITLHSLNATEQLNNCESQETLNTLITWISVAINQM